MSNIIEIPKQKLFTYCLQLTRPVMESVVIREIVEPLCSSTHTLFQKHFSLFHALYKIKTDPAYFTCMVYIHPMNIAIRRYPEKNKCIHYEPWADSFCGQSTVDGMYCSYHYTYYAPFNKSVVFDPLAEFYCDPYNINYGDSEELKKVYNGFTKYIANRRKVEKALSVFLFNAIDDCNKHLLQKRYRELVKKYHPDRFNGDISMIKEINASYALLKEIIVI